jgi:hypothetical protein
MSGVLSSAAAAVGIIDKAVNIAKKLSNESNERCGTTLKLELAKSYE